MADLADLANLATNTFCALPGIKTVRPCFYKRFAASEDRTQNHICENTLILLKRLLKVGERGKDRHTLASLPAKLREYVEMEKRSGLVRIIPSSQWFDKYIFILH